MGFEEGILQIMYTVSLSVCWVSVCLSGFWPEVFACVRLGGSTVGGVGLGDKKLIKTQQKPLYSPSIPFMKTSNKHCKSM